MPYVPVELQKDSKTRTTSSIHEEVRLRFDGWIPTGNPIPNHNEDVVRVTDLDDPSSPARQALDPGLRAAYVAVAEEVAALGRTGRLAAADVTQGLYQRTSMVSFRAMAVDPVVAGRVWGAGPGGISFRDNNGSGTLTVGAALPSAQSPVQLLFAAADGGTPTHLFLVTSGNGDRLGQVWRSVLPAADGTGLNFLKLFDLTGGSTTPAGGVDGGVGSYFREQSLAINNAGGAYVLEYGGVVTGGPSLYYAANVFGTASATLWTKRITWANAKHGHGVRVINGTPFAMLGDAGSTDLGLWRATGLSAGTWSRVSLYGEAAGGNTRYGINLYPLTLDGQGIILSESDTKLGDSVLVFGSQGNLTLPLLPLLRVPPPYQGTVRGLTITSEGNLMWLQTGENGAVGPLDSIWISKYPYTEPVLLESIPSANTLGTIGAPVQSGDYVFFGLFRIRKEKFIGQ